MSNYSYEDLTHIHIYLQSMLTFVQNNWVEKYRTNKNIGKNKCTRNKFQDLNEET